MHSRKSDYQLDIWFPTLEEAQAFGVKETYIEVLEI
jgi:3D (Asp-Asp-Asp) domain-containing protein